MTEEKGPFMLQRDMTGDSLDKTMLTRRVLKRLPKADLHRHLDGSVRVRTIIELAKEQGIELVSMDEEELAKHICVDLKECNSLVDYLEGFDITLKVMQKAYAITRIMYEVCEDAQLDGCKYLEVRFSPILHTREGMALSEVMEAICEGAFMAMVHLPITVSIIVSGMRQLAPRETERLAEITWRYRRKGVMAFDLAGPEDGFSSYYHRRAFEIVRKKLINVTLHSGEAAGADYIKDAIMYCGTHRIGHGVRLKDDPELLQFVADHGIPLEVCVTSNVQTKAVQSLEEHPIKHFFDRGVIIVPCTDNTTVSNVTLTDEYHLIQRAFGFKVDDVVRMIEMGFQAAFVDNTLKARMRHDAIKETLTILQEEGYDVMGVLADAHKHYLYAGITFQEATPPYWKNHTNPDITKSIIRRLPKTDLHCRLCGSVSLDLVWKEAQDAGVDLGQAAERIDNKTIQQGQHKTVSIESFEDLRIFAQGSAHTSEDIRRLKSVFYSVLQTREQLERGVENILTKAFEDGVVYMDLMVRPNAHCRNGLNPDQVLTIILDTVRTVTAKLDRMRCGVVVFCSPKKDDPIQFREMAVLAVENKSKGVCGFGVFGESDMAYEAYPYFTSTFNYLKNNNMNVCIGAGKSDIGSMIEAIHRGGASRLSGAFQVHQFPRLMTYLANHGIPLEMRMSDKFDKAAGDVSSFLGDSPIRLYHDNGLLVTPCSFALSFYASTRSEFIYTIVKECHMNIAETLKLIGHGFKHNFQHMEVRKEQYEHYWDKANTDLTAMGFKHLHYMPYFTSYSIHDPQRITEGTQTPKLK